MGLVAGVRESKPSTFEEAARAIAEECLAVLFSKQRDYGHGNILGFGETGVLVRLHDKVERLKNLWRRRKLDSPENESVDDTWLDAANYAIIAMMLRRGMFELPMAEDRRSE